MSRKGRLKRVLALASLPVLALVAWLGVGDRVMAGGRVLHVVNETSSDVTVRIASDREPTPDEDVSLLDLKPGERKEVLLPEGRYQASVTQEGTPAEIVELTLEGSFRERLVDRTAFVLNIGGAATFLWEQEEYGVAPSGRLQPNRVLFGEPFFVLRDVDYPFVPFPEKIDSGEGTVLRSRLSVFKGTRAKALRQFAKDDPRALDYAERHLTPTHLDEALLAGYLHRAHARGLDARALEFLRATLSPVSIPWHRAYQDRVRSGGPDSEPKLREEYSRLLDDAPRDGRLLYLCGRIAAAAENREEFYRDALNADAACAFAHHALAVLAYRHGKHQNARPHAFEAARLRPHDTSMNDLAYRVRFALGEYASLSEETKASRQSKPGTLSLLRRALELAAAQSDAGRGKELLQEYRQVVRARLKQDPQQLVLHSELLWLGLEQKTAELVKRAGDLKSPAFRARVLFKAHLEAGDPVAAAEALEGIPDSPWLPAGALWQCVAYGRKGNSTAEEEAREWVTERLAEGSKDKARAAALLRDDVRDLDRILQLRVSPSLKAALLLVLGKGDPAFEEAAKRFDVTLYFPHRILNR